MEIEESRSHVEVLTEKKYSEHDVSLGTCLESQLRRLDFHRSLGFGLDDLLFQGFESHAGEEDDEDGEDSHRNDTSSG